MTIRRVLIEHSGEGVHQRLIIFNHLIYLILYFRFFILIFSKILLGYLGVLDFTMLKNHLPDNN